MTPCSSARGPTSGNAGVAPRFGQTLAEVAYRCEQPKFRSQRHRFGVWSNDRTRADHKRPSKPLHLRSLPIQVESRMEEASGVAGAAYGSRHGRTPAGILDEIERWTFPDLTESNAYSAATRDSSP